MKKALSMLCVVLVVGFAGTAFSKKMAKEDVCHNGSVYVGDTSDGAVYDPGMWEPGSFVINISGNAVTKHVANHEDLRDGDFEEGLEVTTEVTLGDDGSGNVIITGFEQQYSCGAPEVIE